MGRCLIFRNQFYYCLVVRLNFASWSPSRTSRPETFPNGFLVESRVALSRTRSDPTNRRACQQPTKLSTSMTHGAYTITATHIKPAPQPFLRCKVSAWYRDSRQRLLRYRTSTRRVLQVPKHAVRYLASRASRRSEASHWSHTCNDTVTTTRWGHAARMLRRMSLSTFCTKILRVPGHSVVHLEYDEYGGLAWGSWLYCLTLNAVQWRLVVNFRTASSSKPTSQVMTPTFPKSAHRGLSLLAEMLKMDTTRHSDREKISLLQTRGATPKQLFQI
jgi:hypothetical protein